MQPAHLFRRAVFISEGVFANLDCIDMNLASVSSVSAELYNDIPKPLPVPDRSSDVASPLLCDLALRLIAALDAPP